MSRTSLEEEDAMGLSDGIQEFDGIEDDDGLLGGGKKQAAPQQFISSRMPSIISVVVGLLLLALVFLVRRMLTPTFVTLNVKHVELAPTSNANVAITPSKSAETLALLRKHTTDSARYCFSYPYGGLTNQFYVILKTLYLAKVTDRVAVLPDFIPEHGEIGHSALSLFFDLPRFTSLTNVDVLEWSSLVDEIEKIAPSQELSCWTWAPSVSNPQPLSYLPIQVNYWPTPPFVSKSDLYLADTHFSTLQILSSTSQSAWLDQVTRNNFSRVSPALPSSTLPSTPSVNHPHAPASNSTALSSPVLPPPPPRPIDELFCFDNLFWVTPFNFTKGVIEHKYGIEEISPVDPVWLEIGSRLFFNAAVDAAVDAILVEFGLKDTAYIGVHIRRGDFIAWGRVSEDPTESLKSYAAGVESMKVEAAKKGHAGDGVKVIFTTDSKEESFIRTTQELGWILIDHAKMDTAQKHGSWWPAMCDAAILSRSVAFVGTNLSTFSYMAARRVETWGNNPTIIV